MSRAWLFDSRRRLSRSPRSVSYQTQLIKTGRERYPRTSLSPWGGANIIYLMSSPTFPAQPPITRGLAGLPRTPIQASTSVGTKIFLSHSTTDRAQVELVKSQIEALGVDVYLAEHDPKPGTSIAAKVMQALKGSDAVVVLITSTSIDSAYVQQEIGLAKAYAKPLVPIIDKGVDKTRLGMLAEVEWLELDLNQPTEALTKMTASLQPLVLRQVAAVNVSVSAAPAVPSAANPLLVLGLGLLIGFLVAAMIFGDGGS